MPQDQSTRRAREQYLEQMYSYHLHVSGLIAAARRMLVDLRVLETNLDNAQEVSFDDLAAGADGLNPIAVALMHPLRMPLQNLIGLEVLTPKLRIRSMTAVIEELLAQLEPLAIETQALISIVKMGEAGHLLRARIAELRDESVINLPFPFVQAWRRSRSKHHYSAATPATNLMRVGFAAGQPLPQSFAEALSRLPEFEVRTWKVKTAMPKETWLTMAEDWALGPESQLRRDLAEVWGMLMCVLHHIKIPPYEGPGDGIKRTFDAIEFQYRHEAIREVLAGWGVPIWMPKE